MTADGTPSPRTGDTITTAAELDALPVGLVLRTVRGYLTEIVLDDRGRRYVRATPDTGGDGGWYTHSERVLDMLPMTVLFRPDAPQPATTDDAVERAARALWVAEQEDATAAEAAARYWDYKYYGDAVIPRDHYRAQARAALAAAGAGVEGTQPGCTGAADCPAPAHVHGCYADTLGHCDNPTDHGAGEAVDREALRIAVGGVLFNAMNYPEAVQTRILGQDTRPLTEKVVDAVLAARGDTAPTEVEWGVRLPTGRVRPMPDEAATHREVASLNAVYARETRAVQRTVSAWREVS